MAHLKDQPYINKQYVQNLLTQFYNELMLIYGNSMDMDILIVGGSALAYKYEYRSTVDIDADIKFSRAINAVINKIALNNSIPPDWINQDFVKSMSYSRRLWTNAIPVPELSNQLFKVYVVSDLDQLCMKATSGGLKDRNDIEFLAENCIKQGITCSMYKERFTFLYGDQVREKEKAKKFIHKLFKYYKML